MKLSALQKFILRENLLNSRQGKISRFNFENFYSKLKKAPAKKIRTNIITKSIERLIDKGLLIGFGEKTQHKLFITHTKLTNRGLKTAKGLLGKQSQLPFKKRK